MTMKYKFFEFIEFSSIDKSRISYVSEHFCDIGRDVFNVSVTHWHVRYSDVTTDLGISQILLWSFYTFYSNFFCTNWWKYTLLYIYEFSYFESECSPYRNAERRTGHKYTLNYIYETKCVTNTDLIELQHKQQLARVSMYLPRLT